MKIRNQNLNILNHIYKNISTEFYILIHNMSNLPATFNWEYMINDFVTIESIIPLNGIIKAKENLRISIKLKAKEAKKIKSYVCL